MSNYQHVVPYLEVLQYADAKRIPHEHLVVSIIDARYGEDLILHPRGERKGIIEPTFAEVQKLARKSNPFYDMDLSKIFVIAERFRVGGTTFARIGTSKTFGNLVLAHSLFRR